MKTKNSKATENISSISRINPIYSYRKLWHKLHEDDRNNITKYRKYRKGTIKLSEDEANSLQMEIICELAEAIMETEFCKSREDMYDENGSYYEEYQDRFNTLYDEIEDKLLNCNKMKTNKIVITYKSRKYILDRVNKERGYHQMAFETDRWSIRIYLLENGHIRIIINKSVKKSETDYHTQFCYDCYCTLNYDVYDKSSHLFLNYVCDPATCRKIKNPTKWFTIEPMLGEIYTQLREELEALHPFDLIHDIRDLEWFIYRKMEENGTTEFTVNNSLRFGIGENAYTSTEEAFRAKEKEPLVLLNLFNGNHVISKDTIIFFLYWLNDRDNKLTVTDGEKTKDIFLKK